MPNKKRINPKFELKLGQTQKFMLSHFAEVQKAKRKTENIVHIPSGQVSKRIPIIKQPL